MKKRFVTLCVIASMSAMVMACGSSSDEKEESGVQIEKIEETDDASQTKEADTTETDNAENTENAAEETEQDDAAEVTEETASEDGAADGDEEGKYVVFTDASNAEVEAYAEKVVTAALAKDWNTIGDMIEYPIGSAEFGNVCNNKDEFVAYANGTGFDETYFTSLGAWDMADLWGNYQGACIDNGNIWFRDVDIEKKEFKIVSFFGMPEGEIEGPMENSDGASSEADSFTSGLWQTVSIGYVENDDDENMQPEYYVQFTDTEIEYGHMKDGEFVPDHSDKISSVDVTDSGYKVKAELSNGTQYTFQTSEDDSTIMEYYGTWNEDEFLDKYSGGSSLMRAE